MPVLEKRPTVRARIKAGTRNEARTVYKGWVDTAYLCRLFSRSDLTINHWRKFEGLPFIEIPGAGRPTIRFALDAVRQWALDHGKEYSTPRLKLRE